MSDQTPPATAETTADEVFEAATPEPSRTRLPLPGTIVVALVVVLFVSAGAYLADQRWGARAMVSTAITGVEALITGDGTKLATLSDDTMKKQLTPQLIAQMKASGMTAEFSKPQWKGNEGAVVGRTDMGDGYVIAAPASEGSSTVVFRTTEALGVANGAVVVTRAWSGWIITGVTVALSQSTTPSVSSTATP